MTRIPAALAFFEGEVSDGLLGKLIDIGEPHEHHRVLSYYPRSLGRKNSVTEHPHGKRHINLDIINAEQFEALDSLR